jgi:hypothetical protein
MSLLRRPAPRSLLPTALASALLLGCSGGPGDAPPGAGATATANPAVTSGPATSASAALAPPASTATAAPPAAAAIGYDGLPAEVPADVDNLHAKSLRAHKAKKWDEAKAGFEEVARRAPGFALARYNLACARARTGDTAGATSLLKDLLALDLPQFQGRFEKDSDLETVRAAPEGQELRSLAASLQPRWREEAPRGVPAVLWRGRTAKSGSQVHTFYRQGVYLPGSRRFLPLGPAPRAREVLSAIVDVANEAVVIVEGAPIEECFADFCPRLAWATVERHPLWGAARQVRWEPGDEGYHIWEVTVALSDGGFLFKTSTQYPTWQRVGPDSKRRADAAATPAGPSLKVSDSGTLLGHTTPGYRVKGHALVLPDRSTIAIDAGHWDGMVHGVTLAPDGSFAVVSSAVSECECDKGQSSLLQHVVSRVDLTARTSEVLAKGPGSAAATIDREGTLFLQVDERMQSVRNGASLADAQPVPEGILLAPPDKGPSLCCGL